eukprot:gene9977-16217_t
MNGPFFLLALPPPDGPSPPQSPRDGTHYDDPARAAPAAAA